MATINGSSSTPPSERKPFAPLNLENSLPHPLQKGVGMDSKSQSAALHQQASSQRGALCDSIKSIANGWLTPLAKHEIALSHEKLQKYKTSFTPLDESYSSLSEDAKKLIHRVLFRLSLTHEKIDDKFIDEELSRHPKEEEKKPIVKFLTSCIKSFSCRNGFSEPNKDVAKSLIKKSILEIQKKATKSTKDFSASSDAAYVYDVLSSPALTEIFLTKTLANEIQILQKYLTIKPLSFECIKQSLSKEEVEFLRKHTGAFSLMSAIQIDKLEHLRFLELDLLTKKEQLILFKILSLFQTCRCKDSILKLSYGAIATLVDLLGDKNKFEDLHAADLLSKKELDFEKFTHFYHPLPRLDEEPLIDIESYLNNRFSKSLQEFILSHSDNLEVFLGNEKELETYFHRAHPDYELKAELKSPSSFRFFQYSKIDNPNDVKLIIVNVNSESRLRHLGYVLKHMGVKGETLKVSGDFHRVYENEIAALKNWAMSLEKKPEILFIGSNVLPCLGALKEKVSNQKTTPKDGSMLCNGDFGEIDSVKVPFVTFSMPNGELAALLTRFWLENGVKKVVMVGAGGAIRSEKSPANVSSYIYFDTSFLEDTHFQIPEENLDPTLLKLKDLDFLQSTKCHRTVSTPLEETQKWLEKASSEDVSLVDVETAHIFKSFLMHLEKSPSITICPGLFISDIVNSKEESLKEKISSKTAFLHAAELIKALLDGIKKTI